MKQNLNPKYGITWSASLAILALILTLGCKNEPKTDSEVGAVPHQEIVQLQMNHGEKWQANKETQEGIKSMDSLITTFKNQERKDYKSLGNQLSKKTSYVIKNCSMKGEAHDQLHVVLIPMLDKITIMKESEDASEAKQALKKLEDLIADYFKHFTLE